MWGAACCVVHGVVFCCGGRTPENWSCHMYSWAGPGSDWIRRPDLPGEMAFHSMVYNMTHQDLWTIGGWQSMAVYVYSLETAVWRQMALLPQPRYNSQSVLCSSHYIITPGGYEGLRQPTDSILLTNIINGQTIYYQTNLPNTVSRHCVALVKQTRE